MSTPSPANGTPVSLVSHPEDPAIISRDENKVTSTNYVHHSPDTANAAAARPDSNGGPDFIPTTVDVNASRMMHGMEQVVAADEEPIAAAAVYGESVLEHKSTDEAAAADPSSVPPLVEESVSVNQDDDDEEVNPQKPNILSLPLDALHGIASFLTPKEWCHHFGTLNSVTHMQCRTILQRVYMHAFQCATEVITAWKLYEQWEDAHELAALYIQAGVPIYPSGLLGYAYPTVHWRMHVEASEMRQGERAEGDPFFGAARRRLGRDVTYLEEKCQFYLHPAPPRPLSFRHLGNTPRPRLARARSSPSVETTTNKVPVVIHQHLYDRHALLHESYVDTQDGKMTTPAISLSADFFHPSPPKPRTILQTTVPNHEADATVELEFLDADRRPADEPMAGTENPDPIPTEVIREDLEASGPSLEGLTNLELEPAAPVVSTNPEPGDLAPLLLDEEPDSTATTLTSVLSLVNLDIYSSTRTSSLSAGCATNTNFPEIRRHLASRFATYQRRLESYLLKGDTYSYEECMLDFWDEFFPHTCGIHYHDTETAVPRITCMHQFLTKPCPKAIGVVQCEIERIKITSRGKGVKGRLFPTYEYRLFIRHNPLPHQMEVSDEAAEDANAEPQQRVRKDFVRRDTVLMVAKNRGRKHTESGPSSSSTTAKKGSNNYYLYVPQQEDIDEHFRKSNERSMEKKSDSSANTRRMEPNGASRHCLLPADDTDADSKSNLLLGRLQSNFIGTEFQIFTPKRRVAKSSRMDVSSKLQFYSEDELDYDSGFSSDNNTNSQTRRSRFRRFLRSPTGPPQQQQQQQCNSDSGSVGSTPVVLERAKLKRTWSSPEHLQSPPRSTRVSRRAIANDASATAASSPNENVPLEEEAGAITYTANLLGSRPRIMDVCVPKVTADGVVGREWKLYLDSVCGEDDNVEGDSRSLMLSCFRQLQHRRDNPEPPPDEADSETGDHDSDFGLLALQNRPPWWNVELGSFVLNFGGRVSVASVKNFQLCERSNQDVIMLQFGRIHGRHSFTMDFRHPLTAVQAFSIAISSLQSKISFG